MTTTNSPAAALLKALLAGWIAIVFGTSALLYFLAPLPQPPYHPNPVLNALRGICPPAPGKIDVA